IWESIWDYHFIYTPFTTNGLWLALTCLRFPSYPPYNTSPHQWIPVLSTTLLHIWRAHWAHHFNAVPIRPSIIIQAINAALVTSPMLPITSLDSI
ncbi:hypothetical protein BCR42DRAFT_337126, partial [Absidia repens]